MFNVRSYMYHWLFVGLFAASPFFMPNASADVAPDKNTEIARASFGIYYGNPRYNRRYYRNRYYPRRNYYYRNNYYRGYRPHYRYRYNRYNRYDRYPRSGGGVYFRIR